MRKRALLPIAVALLSAVGPASAQQSAPPAAQTHFALDASKFDQYAGYYQPSPQSAVRFYREGSRYYFNTLGTAQKMEIFAEADDRFSPDDRPLKFTFRTGPDGSATEVIVNVGGREMIVPRITEQAAHALLAAQIPPPAPAVRNWKVKITPHRVVTTAPAGGVDYWPAYTSDGRRIIFNRSTNGSQGNWALYEVSVTGGEIQPFFARPGIQVTRASSNRRGRIVLMAGRTIWTMRDDGSDAREVPVKDILLPAYPSLSPDGKSVVLTDQARNALYRVDVTSGAATALTRESDVVPGMSSIAPDGRSIAFAGQKNNGYGYNQNQGDNQIWLVDESGATRAMETQPASGRTPNWSPDGKRIAFESKRGSPDNHYAVFVMNRDGSGLVQLTDYALNGNHPVWSPDGKQLVFSWGSEPGTPNGIATVDAPE